MKGNDALINSSLGGATSTQLPPPPASEPERGHLVHLVTAGLEDAKAEDTMVIDLHGKTSIADAMILTSGRSNVHVAAIADRVVCALKQAGTKVRIEGLTNGDWVLIDAGDLIVHVFRPEVRQFYNLEKMWGADRPLTT